jgi:predicted membrane protein
VPVTIELEQKVGELQRRIDDLGSLVEVQSNSFNATVSRMESNLNLLLIILAVASLLIAILGFGIVRVWIRALVERQLRDITTREASTIVKDEIKKIREEWDPKFAEIYDEYCKSGGR